MDDSIYDLISGDGDDEKQNSAEADITEPADAEITEEILDGGAAPEQKRSLGRRIKRNLIRFGVIIAFLFIIFVGLTVMLYPNISNFVNTKNASRVINIYEESLVPLSDTDFLMQLNAAREYNARLAGSGVTVRDAFVDEEEDVDRTDEYWDLVDVAENGMMGYVEILQLGIKLPIYHGVSESVLAKGVGHIQGSSLPVGGEGAHAIISAHTGLPRAKLFTGVDTMQNGDTFTIYVLNETLTYQVDQILTVLPHEIDALSIQKGADYVTLVTCTPYGINSHRLLIRGTRIETPEEVHEDIETQEAAEQESEPTWFQNAVDAIVGALSIVVEKAAEGLVNITEWGMDLFGVEY
ncbi:MAG: class C sortase [Clostridiales bacterium]|nr:class C sortase [Clostridiales bacterium]